MFSLCLHLDAVAVAGISGISGSVVLVLIRRLLFPSNVSCTGCDAHDPLKSLIKSIMAGRGQLTLEEERETVGVSVQGHVLDGENQNKGTDVKFYDLAGQVDYYGLHQLFLTETALYVLVWDASKYRHQTEVMISIRLLIIKKTAASAMPITPS